MRDSIYGLTCSRSYNFRNIFNRHSEDRAAVDADALRHDGATGMVAQNGTLELDNVLALAKDQWG